MVIRLRRLAAGAAALLVLTCQPAFAASALFRLSDPRLDELSGLAVGIRSPGVLYAQNDSGDSARFFALDAGTGAVRGEYDVPGVTAVDWEDIAVAPDARGVPSVWLADIGDNDSQRSAIEVYRVDEPRVGDDGAVHRTAAPQTWRLRYPDGPHNAEAILVDPVTHRFSIATKDFLGRTVVYAAPPTPTVAVQTLTRIGTFDLSPTGTPGGPNVVGQLTVTAGSISADGSVMVLRTYTDAYLWRLGDGRVQRALTRQPTRVALPAEPLGEGIALQRTAGGLRMLTDSEQVGSAVYAVSVPSLPAADPAPTRRSSAADTSGTTAGTAEDGPNLLVVGVPTIGVLLLGVAVVWAVRRARRRG